MINFNNIQFYLLISGCYLITRLINLGIIPIFTDEAIYSYWAQVALNDPANRYISLVDGKQPLFIWISAIFQNFIADPLIATRMTSVLSGALAVIGIYLVARELFSVKVAKIASILYIFLPFTLLYDRLALYDSLLTMLGLFSVYFSLRLVKNPRLDFALLNGMTIGLALLTKSSGYFYIFYIPTTLLLINLKAKNAKTKLIKWFYFSFLSVVLAQIIYNTLRLSPFFYIISQKNLEFIRPLREVIDKPFLHLSSNLITIANWLSSYLGLPLLVLFTASTLYFLYRKNIKILLLSTLVFLPLFAEGLFNKVLYPRFLLFYFPYLIITVAYTLSNIAVLNPKFKPLIMFSLAIIFAIPLFNSFLLLTNPAKAKIASSDLGQYLNDWPAGFGVKESAGIIQESAKSGPTYVATEGTFGLLPYALNIYFYSHKNVEIIGFWPVNPENLPQQVLDSAQNKKAYFIFNENQKDITNARLKLVGRYQKGIGNTFLRIYEVLPQ